MTDKGLFLLAKEAAGNAYAPYSGFRVGAALVTGTGKIYMGANIENASFGGTICAERVAAVKALYDGERDFVALAVYAERAVAWPCGICRQFLAEFGTKLSVIVGTDEDSIQAKALGELLPEAFRLNAPAAKNGVGPAR